MTEYDDAPVDVECETCGKLPFECKCRLQTPKQRAERAYRARRLAAGDKLLRVWMTPETQRDWCRWMLERESNESALARALKFAIGAFNYRRMLDPGDV